jgi:hypothetical protein
MIILKKCLGNNTEIGRQCANRCTRGVSGPVRANQAGYVPCRIALSRVVLLLYGEKLRLVQRETYVWWLTNNPGDKTVVDASHHLILK